MTDGNGPVLAERGAGVATFFSLTVPQLLQGPTQICAVGFVGNPDLLSLPLPRFSCWQDARAAYYLATAVPFRATGHLSRPRRPQKKGQGLPMLAMPTTARGGGVLYSLNWTALGLAMQPAETLNQRPSSEFCPLLRHHLGHPTEFREASSAPLVGQQYLTQWLDQHCHPYSLTLCYAL